MVVGFRNELSIWLGNESGTSYDQVYVITRLFRAHHRIPLFGGGSHEQHVHKMYGGRAQLHCGQNLWIEGKISCDSSNYYMYK